MASFNGNFEAILALVAGGATLSSVLSAGNTTGNNALVVSNPVGNPNARVQGEDSAAVDAVASGDLVLRAGNKTAGTGDGGDLLLFAGTSTGGNPGVINISGDTTFNDNVSVIGSFSTSLLLSGAGSPEGAVVASPGALYQRTTPTSLGNTLYIKLTGVGNTGWAPLGPRINENFLAPGGSAVFTLTSSDNFYRNVAGTPDIDLQVYWNGVRLTEGAATGDFAVTGANSIEIRDGAGNPLSPLAGDRIVIDYLPL